MNTPAAKRRRVDAANATLRKPFHSPLLRRQPDAGDNNTPGSSSRTPELNSGKRSFQEVYSPSSPSAAKQPQAARPAQPGASNPRAQGKLASSPKPSFAPGAPRAVDKRKTSSGSNKSGAAAGPGDDDNPFLALARAHGTAAPGHRDAIVRDLDRQLETVKQAGDIEAASERSRPGEPVDQELRDLVAKWRGAGRVAAEELFETVKERVDNAGGPKAWKEMQQRQLEFYQGFDQEPPAKSKDSDEESDPEYSQDVQAHLEGIERCDEAEGQPDEDDEPEFNMGHMLQSLNIDFSLLGYDEKEDKWIDQT